MEINKNNCVLVHIHSRISSVGRVVDCRVGVVMGLIPGAGPILGVLKKLRNEFTSFALQTA